MRPLHVRVLCVLLLLASMASADDKRRFFSISTDKTYLPGETIKLRMYSQEVDVLEFRLYRVNNPAMFFKNLQDVHNFGGRPFGSRRENIDERTRLEQFHDWKHGLWIELRNFIRTQFSPASRAQIREKESGAGKSSSIAESAGFAQVPLLNSQQLVARWKQMLPPKYASESQRVPIEALKSGVYLVEATDGQYKAYTVVIVTEMAMITKIASGQIVTYTVERRGGAPQPDVPVMIWANKKVAGQFRTDAQGLGEARIKDGNFENAWILAQHGDDVAIVSPYSFYLSSDPERDWVGYVYTDRPVYRPGHSVQIKTILRKRNGELLELPARQEVNVSVSGPDNKKIFEKTLALSSIGTAHTDFDLTPAAALGYYSIAVNGTGFSQRGSFFVEEYKKPEYDVKVTPVRSRVLQGDTVKATIEARYYFGEPVANAKVKYVVHTQRYWPPWYYEEGEGYGEEMGGGEGGEGLGGGDYVYEAAQVSEQEGKLDADGRLTINIPTHASKGKFDVNYRVEARVTDAANREISGHGYVLATYGSFTLNLKGQSYVYQQDETGQFTVEARDYDQHPIQTAVHIELRRNIGYAYAASYKPADVISTREEQTGPDGAARFGVPLISGGSFELVATATTSEGRTITSTTWVWVQGTGEQQWWGETRQLTLVADKKSYHVGDVARVLLVSNVKGANLLVTTEGRTVQTKRVVQAKDTSLTFEVPITTEQEPNFFVSVTFIKDNVLYQASKSLKVPAVERKLQVEVESSKKQFRPGEKGSLLITAKDVSGKPVSAEFSVGVVDEAIYAVRPDISGEILNAFYPPVYPGISTDASLNFYFHGEAGKRSMLLAGVAGGLVGGRALAQLKSMPDLVQPKIRKAFPDTALWLADVKTDTRGRAQASVTFPDSLTTWRATVRGITNDSKVGSAVERVIVRKNLMVRIVAPRFMRQGDEVTVSAVVHNYLTDAKTVRVSLDATSVDLLQGNSRDVTVPSRGEAKVDWTFRARPSLETKLTAKALTNEESDAMEIILPITPYGVKQATVKSGSITELSGTAQFGLVFPTDTQATSHAIEVTLSPSVAGTVFGALDYLTSYPYGCTEQTMSSFLPNIIVARAMTELKLKPHLDPAELEKKIRAGSDRLYDYQHEDGGWGWWKEDESTTFMTAYVVFGLAQAREAGYEVRAESLRKAENWLKETLKQHPNMISDLRAYVVFALAQAGIKDRGLLDSVWERKEKLSAQGIAEAGLTMRLENDTRTGQAVALLEQKAKTEDGTLYWPSGYDGLMEISTDNSSESTAYAVKLISNINPQSPSLPKAAQWLVNHRDQGYYWESTQQTAMVIYGLMDYVKSTRELGANFTADVLVDGKPVLSHRFTPAETISDHPPSVRLSSEVLKAGGADIEIRKKGEGKLYWSARGQYFSTSRKLYQSGTLSLNLTRDYYRLAPQTVEVNGEPKITYSLDAMNGALHPGDTIAVRLTVNGDGWKYLLVEDPIPAGTEFIERDDLYEIQEKPLWWQYWFTRREFHDDHAALFQTYLSWQRNTYFYLLKVVNPGKFIISPAMVQPMYQPSVQATTDSLTLEVK